MTKIRLLLVFLFLTTQANAENIYHDKNSEAGKAIQSLDAEKLKFETLQDKNNYIQTAKEFIVHVQNSRIESMLDLTSKITIDNAGNDKVISHYRSNIIPAFKNSTVSYKDDDFEYFVDEFGNAGIEIFGTKKTDKLVRFGVSVLKENGHYVVGLIRSIK